ncbi:hypothetical protein ACJ6WD_40005 [Streptomyces sp. VTCC 41912]|uniref:hypothetical protein n=1 Tax=Streptomyces sp. VTCC 41912 TaxID=3383243 RepID=UPI00389693A8
MYLSAIPVEVPIMTKTSTSEDHTPTEKGIDPARQWWAEAVRRPRYGDARATVTPPGAEEHEYLLSVVLPADDLDDAEETARYAINIARQLVTLAADPRSPEALAALRLLLSPDGPQASHSQASWYKVRCWIDEVRATRGQVVPSLHL